MNAVITGASRGIGKAIAETFAANGYNLFLCSIKEENLLRAAKELKERFPQISLYTKATDLGKRENATEFADWVLSQTNTIDILVNNAGTFMPGNISDEEVGVLERTMEVNLYSVYYLTRAFLPKMISQKRGHIFNLGSIAGLQAYPNGGSYSISKFALMGFSKNLRHELKPYGVKVTIILPGAVYTDSWKASGVAEERIMESADIASLVYAATQLSPQATVEEIVVRPQLGDL